MMSQRRQDRRAKMQADADFECNLESEKRIEALQLRLDAIEEKKLDIIISEIQLLRSDLQKETK
jgi:uncharacterized membrane protein